MGVETRVFCMTYYTHDKSLYLRFYGCNLSCIYCINKLSPYDTHIPLEILRLLESRPIKTLSLDGLRLMLDLTCEAFDVKSAVLGGGEPTLDENLIRIVELLKKRGISIRLLTNGVLLDVRALKGLLDENDSVVISVKALDADKYELITGKKVLDKVLENTSMAYHMGLNVIIEVVLAPPLIRAEDVEKIARWIAFELGPNTTLIIDKYVPVPNVNLQRPNKDEVECAYERARAYLKNVIVRMAKNHEVTGGYIVYRGVRIAWCWRCIGDVHLIYPSLPLPHEFPHKTLNFE